MTHSKTLIQGKVNLGLEVQFETAVIETFVQQIMFIFYAFGNICTMHVNKIQALTLQAFGITPSQTPPSNTLRPNRPPECSRLRPLIPSWKIQQQTTLVTRALDQFANSENCLASCLKLSLHLLRIVLAHNSNHTDASIERP